jgi:hypothetical protein
LRKTFYNFPTSSVRQNSNSSKYSLSFSSL